MLLGTQDKDFFPSGIKEKFRFIKDMRFDCYEIDGKLLVENVKEVQEAMEESGLIVCTACNGYGGWIGDFIEEKREKGIADLKNILQAIKAVGGTGVVVPAAWGMFTFRLPPMVSPRSKDGDEKALLMSLAELDKAAGETGTYIYLEPLNRYQDHMLNTTEDAYKLIKKGDFKRVKITADFYHMSIEEDSIPETLKKYKDYIGHVHIAENHRYQPGTGSLDWKSYMDTLREIGYEGAVVNEGRVRGEDPLAAYRASVGFMKKYI